MTGKLMETKTAMEAVDRAIELERESIIHYLEMMNLLPEIEKLVIDGIIKEEHDHYLKLSELKIFMSQNEVKENALRKEAQANSDREI